MTWTPHENKPLLVRFSEWLVEPDEWPAWVQFFLLPKPLGRENFFAVRVILLIAMAFFSLQAFFKGYESWIAQFLHNLNLPVHETGHIVFRIFGSPVITSLGGSLFQTIMPLVFCFALWIKPRDLFGASIALWWAFENLIDVAPYIEDALPMKLTLISGGTGAEAPYGFHDWNFILPKQDSSSNATRLPRLFMRWATSEWHSACCGAPGACCIILFIKRKKTL